MFKNESLQEIKVVGGIDSITPDSGSQNSCDIIVKIVGKGLKTKTLYKIRFFIT